jgi:hypothetical protein
MTTGRRFLFSIEIVRELVLEIMTKCWHVIVGDISRMRTITKTKRSLYQ